MTGSEWWNTPRPAPERRGRIGGHMARGILGGIVAVILVAIAAVLWNASSKGGLVHLLGGVTSEELVAEAAKHPGPPGPAGPPGAPAPAAANPAVFLILQNSQDFDKSGPVPGSDATSLCALSKIVLHRYVAHPDRSCELTPGAQRNEPWQIVVNGAVCGVACFTVGPKK
jgi:predicted lipid-binding transport protein (Tim44 family)